MMFRFLLVGFVSLLGLLAVLAASLGSNGWWLIAAVLVLLAGIGIHDLVQKRHAVLRNYPVIGHLRYLMEEIRPELQQYFIERNYDGRPYDRDTRTSIYQRSKGQQPESPFGTQREVNAPGHEFLVHSMTPVLDRQRRERIDANEGRRVRLGGPDCTQPYDIAWLNVSAMSFGSLSGNAIRALNAGAQKGGFAHDTGEGGLSVHHEQGGDLIWEIGTAYFGCRTEDGDFDPDQFAETATKPQVKAILLKLSQGAKPGLGGVLPGEKVNGEVAQARSVPEGVTVISPPGHRTFSSPRELVRFVAELRRLADGKPVGIKLCVGSRRDVLALCKAMRAEGTAPDFVVVDGAEGGTGAAPTEYQDYVGMPLTEGLLAVDNALRGAGLRDQVKVGVSGKVATGVDVVKRMTLGADFTNAARAMMMAIGCIQAQKCHTNACPVGVATQDTRRARALDVPDKTDRVFRYQAAVVDQVAQIMASMGVHGPDELRPDMLRRRIDHVVVHGYDQLYDHLGDGQLLDDVPATWRADWELADPDRFAA